MESKLEVPSGARLIGLREVARLLGISFWAARDLALSGALKTVKLPSGRIETGRTRGGKRPVRVVAPATDPRMKSLRRVLVDVRDVEALIERCRGAAEG